MNVEQLLNIGLMTRAAGTEHFEILKRRTCSSLPEYVTFMTDQIVTVADFLTHSLLLRALVLKALIVMILMTPTAVVI